MASQEVHVHEAVPGASRLSCLGRLFQKAKAGNLEREAETLESGCSVEDQVGPGEDPGEKPPGRLQHGDFSPWLFHSLRAGDTLPTGQISPSTGEPVLQKSQFLKIISLGRATRRQAFLAHGE